MFKKLRGAFLFEKNFLFTVVSIALPIALQNIISFGVNLMDSVMLGQLGDVAITAANLGGQPFFLLTMFGFGLASGGSVLIAQYWGKGDIGRIRRVMAMSLQSVFVVSLLFTLASLLFPYQLMRLFTPDEAVIKASVEYLSTLAFSYLFYSLSNCYLMCLRAVERVRISTLIYGVSFFVNVFFNWCFIFGKCGAPALGVRGAAIGTILARMSECALSLLYMYMRENRAGFRLRHLLRRWDGALLRDFLKHSLPVVGNELLWGLGTVLMTMIISNLGDVFVTANSIANVVNQVTSVAAFGVANAAAVLTGKAVGAGRPQTARKTANTLLLFSLIVGLCGGLLLFVLRGPILTIYAITPAARALTLDIMTVLAVLQPILALELNCIVGVLRGGGDTRTAFFIDCGCLWLISLPLGLLGGYVLGLAPAAIYLLMRVDTVLKTGLGLWRIRSGRWIKNITR
ncbi:MAG: MATE family efflux transporter [Oscillospiraceae bacterium]|nr:MATE family efflux transporter [Oscillospiraceae bacterium]